jgi:hypothetical protein
MTVKWPLIKKLFPLSIEKNDYSLMFKEWERDSVKVNEKYGDSNCICGHMIKIEYLIVNKYNKNEAVLGSCCIRLINRSLELKWATIKNYLISALILAPDNKKGFVSNLLEKYTKYKKDYKRKFWKEWKIKKTDRYELQSITHKKYGGKVW